MSSRISRIMRRNPMHISSMTHHGIPSLSPSPAVDSVVAPPAITPAAGDVWNTYTTSIHVLRAWTLQLPSSALKKVKVAHTRLPSIGFRSWSRYLAVSLQVTWIINPTVGSHYFLPGLQLPMQPLRGLLPILLLGEQRHNGCEQFA